MESSGTWRKYLNLLTPDLPFYLSRRGDYTSTAKKRLLIPFNTSCLFTDGRIGECIRFEECPSAISLASKGVIPSVCSLEEGTVCCVDYKSHFQSVRRPEAQSNRKWQSQGLGSGPNVKDTFDYDPDVQRRKPYPGVSGNTHGKRKTDHEIVEEPNNYETPNSYYADDGRPSRVPEDDHFIPPGLAKKKPWREEKTTENDYFYEHLTKKPARGPNHKGPNKHVENDSNNSRKSSTRPEWYGGSTTSSWYNSENDYESNYFNQRTTAKPNYWVQETYTTTKRPEYFGGGDDYNIKPSRRPQRPFDSNTNRPDSQGSQNQGNKRPNYQGGSSFGGNRPDYQQNTGFEGYRPGSNQGNNYEGNRPGSNQGNSYEGNRPGSNQGNNYEGKRPGSNQGNNYEGKRPGSNQGNNYGGNRPGSNQGNNYEGKRPGSNQGNNYEGNRPGSNQGNNYGGNRPGSNQGNSYEENRPNYHQSTGSGGDRPNYNQGNNFEGNRPNYQQGSNFEGKRPGSRPRPQKKKRISEQKCEEYSKQITENITGLPLTTNPDPVIIPVRKCITPQQLIVGGENTTLGEFPHMAAVGFRDRNKKEISWNCGGTLISEQFVMTAAHCTSTSSGRPVKVRLGEYNLVKDDDGAHPVDYAVVDIITHPGYKPPSKYNDVALLKLSRKVTFFKHIRPACLYSEETFSATKAIATGWGRIYYDGGPSEILQKVVLSIVDNPTCNRLYKVNVKTAVLARGIVESQLCAGELSGGKDTCQGDSGGPLSITNSKCIHHVIGITSFGKSCAFPNSTGVYTRVSAYVPWIESVVWPETY